MQKLFCIGAALVCLLSVANAAQQQPAGAPSEDQIRKVRQDCAKQLGLTPGNVPQKMQAQRDACVQEKLKH